jgi:hypothetical protein
MHGIFLTLSLSLTLPDLAVTTRCTASPPVAIQTPVDSRVPMDLPRMVIRATRLIPDLVICYSQWVDIVPLEIGEELLGLMELETASTQTMFSYSFLAWTDLVT